MKKCLSILLSATMVMSMSAISAVSVSADSTYFATGNVIFVPEWSLDTPEYEMKADGDIYTVKIPVEKETWENTENTDWAKAYEESHFTIGEMLDELRRYVEKEMCVVEPCSGQGRYLKRLYNDLQDWELVDTDYERV